MFMLNFKNTIDHSVNQKTINKFKYKLEIKFGR
jgi:hypothetical protein